MNRRDFTGTFLGLISGVPVLAKAQEKLQIRMELETEAKYPIRLQDARRKVEFCESEGKGAILLVNTDKGDFEISKIEKSQLLEDRLILKFGTFEPNQKLIIMNIAVLDRHRKLIGDHLHKCHLGLGDVYKLEYTFGF